MIRINLLGQIRPKATRGPVPLGSALPSILILAGVVFGLAILGFYYSTLRQDLKNAENRIQALNAEKTNLMQIKLQVEAFERQREELQHRVNVIEQLQRDRTGGQELLDMVANTVSRTENLWLTSMTRKGGSLAIEGWASSVNSVANFITQLKRSGYFQKVEIKEAKQDDKPNVVQTFAFQMTAEIAPSSARASSAIPANAPAKPARTTKAPEKKG